MEQKNTLLAVAGVAVVLIALALYYFMKPEPVAAPAPAYGTDNPLEKKPDLTPTNKTNPYSDVKTNPFE